MIRTILIRTWSGGKFYIKGYHNYYLGLYDFPCTPVGRKELLTEKYRKRAGNKCEKPCSDKCEKFFGNDLFYFILSVFLHFFGKVSGKGESMLPSLLGSFLLSSTVNIKIEKKRGKTL